MAARASFVRVWTMYGDWVGHGTAWQHAWAACYMPAQEDMCATVHASVVLLWARQAVKMAGAM